MTGKELVKLLEQNGWKLIRQESSHKVFQKGEKKIVVSDHGNKPIPTGLLHKLLREAGLK